MDERPRQAWPPERPAVDAPGEPHAPQGTPRRARRGSAPYAPPYGAPRTRVYAAPTCDPPDEPRETETPSEAGSGTGPPGLSGVPGSFGHAGAGPEDGDHLVWSPVQDPHGTRPPEGHAQHRASMWDPTEPTEPEPPEKPVDGAGSGWVSEETDEGDLRGWTSEEFRGETPHPWAFWRRGRARRQGRARREEGIWPEESVWEVHRPWPLSDDDSPQDELPPSARWYGSPVAPPPSRAGRLRRLLVGTVAAIAGLAVGFAVAVLLPPLLLRQVPADAKAASRPAVVSDPVAGVTYPLPSGWRVGAVPPVTGFTSIAGGEGGEGGEGTVTVMTGPAEPGDDLAGTAADLADLYGRLLLHGDKVKVVEDRAVTVGGRSGRSRSLRAEYHDVVNRPAYLRLVLLTGKGGRPVVVVGVAQPDDPRLRGVIDKVISELR
ncbi:hypothetical protein [Streptosporangium saharense]|uniref:Uncharacterized protein n=1 Tax=Streptosporangium saharense TaxID=1706840 RepID=A0A7W7VLE6_9ACTN|nr:hypothetical protein [Streptosporangium saharense]MBB4914592.1 hypothetical protein [Streptosporangium saharense]